MSEDLIQVLNSIDKKLDILDTIYNIVGYQTTILYVILIIIIMYLLCKLYYFVLAIFEAN